MDAGGSAAIAVLAVDHWIYSAVELTCTLVIRVWRRGGVVGPAHRHSSRVGIAQASRFRGFVAREGRCGDRQLAMKRRGELDRGGEILFGRAQAERGLPWRLS